MKKQKKFFTTHEAAEKLMVTPTTVILWINDGKIKCRKTLGGHRRIPISEIDRVLKEMEA